jgi:hypothetical protein
MAKTRKIRQGCRIGYPSRASRDSQSRMLESCVAPEMANIRVVVPRTREIIAEAVPDLSNVTSPLNLEKKWK